MNISSSKGRPVPRKMMSVKKRQNESGGSSYDVSIDPQAIASASKDGAVKVGGALSTLAHAPFSIAGPLMAPSGYERKDFQPVVSAERSIGIGTGVVLGTAIQLLRGSGLVSAMLVGGTLGAAAGGVGVTVGHSLKGWKPLLLDNIAQAKGEAVDSTSGSPARKAGAALRRGLESGFQVSWRRGTDTVEHATEVGGDFADGFMNPGT